MRPKELSKQILPKFVKYPKIPYVEECPIILGHEGYIFEKIDGSIVQVRKTGEGIVGGSKANYLTGNIIRRSIWRPEFLKWMYSNESLYSLPQEVIMFGEWLKPIDTDYDTKNLNKFYFIDLASVEKEKPVLFDYNEALDYLSKWGIENIEVLPPIGEGFFTEEMLEEIVNTQKSQLGTSEIEGVVLKNYRIQEFAKYLHPRHSEIRKQAQTLERRYLTKMRVKKAVRRLQDEKAISKPTLDQVANEVVIDIFEESEVSFDIDAVKRVIKVREYYVSKFY